MHTQEQILKPQTKFEIFGLRIILKKKNMNSFFILTIGTRSEPQMPLVMQQCGQAFHPDLAQLCFLKKCNLTI